MTFVREEILIDSTRTIGVAVPAASASAIGYSESARHGQTRRSLENRLARSSENNLGTSAAIVRNALLAWRGMLCFIALSSVALAGLAFGQTERTLVFRGGGLLGVLDYPIASYQDTPPQLGTPYSYQVQNIFYQEKVTYGSAFEAGITLDFEMADKVKRGQTGIDVFHVRITLKGNNLGNGYYSDIPSGIVKLSFFRHNLFGDDELQAPDLAVSAGSSPRTSNDYFTLPSSYTGSDGQLKWTPSVRQRIG